MFVKIMKAFFAILCLLATAGIQVGCSEKENQDNESITLSGTLSDGGSQQKASQYKVGRLAIADYEFYCVTFSESPVSAVSAIDASGQFSLEMPIGVPFGCFINDAVTKVPVATLAVAGDDQGFGSSSSPSMQLKDSINLGALNLDLERGEVLVPRATIAPAMQVTVASNIDLDAMANSSYQMNCLPTGNSVLDQRCNDNIAEDDGDNEIFFRIMKGTKNGAPIQGIGVWESEQAFNDCGGIDLLDQTVSDINSEEGIEFLTDGILAGPAFSTGMNCPVRDSGAPESHENLELYYAAGELIADGNGYTLYAKDSHEANPGCRIENTTVVHFTGSGANRLVGQFQSKQRNIELGNGLGDCSHLENNSGVSFMVEFIKQ